MVPAFCLMAGIGAGCFLSDWTTGLAVLALVVVLTLLLRRRPHWQTAGIWLCCLLLGMTLGRRRQQQMDVEWSQQRTTLQVVVVGEPVVKERWVVCDVLTATGHRLLKCHIRRDEQSEGIRIGDGLSLSVYISKVHAYKKNHFDYRRYMLCHGFTGEAFVSSDQWQWQTVSLKGLSVLERSRLRFLCWRHELLLHYRQWGIGDDAYGIIAAMTLGEKSRLDPQLKDTYSRVGASHILALSGLHLMIIYGVITLFIGWWRFRTVSQVLTVLAVWAFALLVGLSPSVVRSATMISIYALLSLGYRQRMSVNTLAFVAIAMLIVNPLALYDMGFQLSFMAVLAILLMNPLFRQLVPPHILQRHRWLGTLWGLATVSLAAQIGTAPLVAYYFGYIVTSFLLTNFIVIPLATLALYLTLLCVVVSPWPLLVGWVAAALSSAVMLMNRLLAWVATLPYCSVDGIRLSTLQVLLIYVVLACGYVLVILRYPATRRSG